MIGASVIRRAAVLSALGASALGAAGRLEAAGALTLGAVVAIVSALWISGLVGRLAAPVRGAESSLDRKFALGGVLRYAVFGVLIYAGVRTVPSHLPWLAVGASAVVASLLLEETIEWLGRGSRGVRTGEKRSV